MKITPIFICLFILGAEIVDIFAKSPPPFDPTFDPPPPFDPTFDPPPTGKKIDILCLR